MKTILHARQTHGIDDYATTLTKGFDLPFLPHPGMFFSEASSSVGFKVDTVALGLDGVVRVEGTTQWGTAVEALQNRDVFIECALRHGWRANATWSAEEIEPAAVEAATFPTELKLEIVDRDYTSYLKATRAVELPFVPTNEVWIRTAEGVDAQVASVTWKLDDCSLEVRLETEPDGKQWAGVVQDMLRDHVETAGWSIQIQRLFGEDRELGR